MLDMNKMKKLFLVILISLFLFPLISDAKKDIKVLILSGNSNHNWEQSTKQLE